MPLYVRSFLATGPPEEVERAASEHREHLRELHRRGNLRAAGEFANGDGFLEIIRAKDRLEAESLTRSSPLIERGLGSWMLREWVESEFV